MVIYDSREVERKAISILKVLNDSPQPLGKDYRSEVERIRRGAGRTSGQVSPEADG